MIKYERYKDILKITETCPILDSHNSLEMSTFRGSLLYLTLKKIAKFNYLHSSRQFDGSIRNWSLFYANLNILIHVNASLAPIEIFHYLNLSLSGHALSIAKNCKYGLKITDNGCFYYLKRL